MGKTGSEKNKHAKDSRHKQTQLNKYSGDTEEKRSWNTWFTQERHILTHTHTHILRGCSTGTHTHTFRL